MEKIAYMLHTGMVRGKIPGIYHSENLGSKAITHPFKRDDFFKNYFPNKHIMEKNFKARAPRRSKEGLILLVPHSLACNVVFGRGMKYRCVQRAGSTT